MSAPVLNSISPTLGAPGVAITVTGSGFTAASRVGCPSLVPTTYIDANTLTAEIPAMEGPAGASIRVQVYVLNADGAVSNTLDLSIDFPIASAQGWTTVDNVAGEIPNFQRAAAIPDSTIVSWIQSISQSVTAVLLRRALPLDPSQWAQPDAASAAPTAAAVLELITRYGAAARLAAAVAGQFTSGVNALQADLSAAYKREYQLLDSGGYDKLFFPAAATEITGRQFASNLDSGCPAYPFFRKEKVF